MRKQLRRIAILMSAALLGATPVLVGAGAASASAASPDSTASAQATWKYVDSYFWASDCIAAGNRGIDNGAWQKYECRDGSTWSNYKLWVFN